METRTPTEAEHLEQVQHWLGLRAQALAAAQALKEHAHARELLLLNPQWDGLAAAHGLRVSRPDATEYRFERDAQIARAQQRLEALESQVRTLRERFRQECREGVREIGVDFEPGRSLRIEACATAREMH
jgi:hypothetical protein